MRKSIWFTSILVLGCSRAKSDSQASQTEELPDPRSRWVIATVTEERSAPESTASVENRIYRGQRVTAFDSAAGWIRVTEPGFEPRWVDRTALAANPPAPLPQPGIPPEYQDQRIAADAIPQVGEGALTADEVLLLWKGAKHMLTSGQCDRVDYADKSVNRPGTYYVTCGGRNVFFSASDIP